MNNFELLTAAYLQDRKKQTELNTEYITHGYMSTWHSSEKTVNDNGIRRYLTELRWNQYQEGKIDRDQAINYAIKRMTKQAEKTTAAGLEKLAQVAAADDLTFATVNITYSRDYNATADSWTNNGRFTGHAGGYGYDKESAAAAQAFNADMSMLKILYQLKEEGLKNGLTSDSATACTGHDNRHIIGYGAGYSVLPYYEGGVGIECFWRIIEKAGYKVNCFFGKHENNYKIEKA